MTKQEFDKAVAEARRRVKSMDAVDGFQDRFLPTIHAALETGLKNPGGPEFDAYVMLEDLIAEKRVPGQKVPV